MATNHLLVHQRIAGRLTLLGVIPAVLLLGIFTAVKIRGDDQQAVEQTEVRLQRVAAQVAARLETQKRAACELVQTKAVEASPYAALFEPMLGESRGCSGMMSMAKFRTAIDPATGRPCMWAHQVLPLPDGHQWDVIVRENEKDALPGAETGLITQLLTAGGGVSLLAVLLPALAILVGKRLAVASTSATAMAGGDLSGTAPHSDGRNEAAYLVNALGAMHHGMKSHISKVEEATININSTATEPTAMARQQERNSHGLGASTTQVAAAAKQIADEVSAIEIEVR